MVFRGVMVERGKRERGRGEVEVNGALLSKNVGAPNVPHKASCGGDCDDLCVPYLHKNILEV